MTEVKEAIREDYVHSANSLFHFMSESAFLFSALKRQALCPRYCVEDISYLHIHNGDINFDKVAVLQKCFCDIPLRNIIKKFPVRLTENNSLSEEQKKRLHSGVAHTDLYGGYALAFSKKWGEENKLQPVHYLSEEAENTKQFTTMVSDVLALDSIPDTISDSILNMMCYFKPLRGTMSHRLVVGNSERVECEIFKNFHDEHEWRFVPWGVYVEGNPLDCLIANSTVGSGYLSKLSKRIEDVTFKAAWLPFRYEDIRYVIVPDYAERGRLISFLCDLPFEDVLQHDILISKILVLDDIVKDF